MKVLSRKWFALLRNLISINYKRKVEKLVRKYEKVEEKDPVTPCPFCSSLVPNMQLECGHCNRTIPVCHFAIIEVPLLITLRWHSLNYKFIK
jgi:WD repeat-containing protein 19